MSSGRRRQKKIEPKSLPTSVLITRSLQVEWSSSLPVLRAAWPNTRGSAGLGRFPARAG